VQQCARKIPHHDTPHGQWLVRSSGWSGTAARYGPDPRALPEPIEARSWTSWFPRQAAAYADYVVGPARQFGAVPEGVDTKSAAATRLAATTAWQILHDVAGVQAGQKVLIIAAGGMVTGHPALRHLCVPGRARRERRTGSAPDPEGDALPRRRGVPHRPRRRRPSDNRAPAFRLRAVLGHSHPWLTGRTLSSSSRICWPMVRSRDFGRRLVATAIAARGVTATATHWTKDAAATGQLAAMVMASLATLGFTSIAARFTRTNVRIVLVAAGAVAVLAAIYASAPVLLLVGIFLALFAATLANATQVSVATASVPEPQKPTAIGLFTLLYLLGGAIGPALASALVLS
jgi:Major Facilitator Superfamily